jgi:hypothetical protein
VTSPPRLRAGGKATAAGMSFQAQVGTWFAAHVVSRMPISRGFGIAGSPVPTSIQLETQEGLDDLVVELSTGDQIQVQCSTHPSLSQVPKSKLAKVLRQVVQLFLESRKAAAASPHSVLAVEGDAARSLDDLHDACRLLDTGGNWSDVLAQANQKMRDALGVFAIHVRSAWMECEKQDPTDNDLVAVARSFRIERFEVDIGGRDWREAALLIGSRVYGGEHLGEPPLASLQAFVETLNKTGALADRNGMLDELRIAGHEDITDPHYDRDVESLRRASRKEFDRLQRHRLLPIGNGVPIPRDCRKPLEAAAKAGSFVVVGEPGAGKTGALLELLESWHQNDFPSVFLSVDALSGVKTRTDLREELDLAHDVLDVMQNWPGTKPCLLIIDALDASREAASEKVFSRIIEDVLSTLAHRWSVVASIRTFDLINGRQIRGIMKGSPPNKQFSEKGLQGVRHFRVPCLSDHELMEVSGANQELKKLLEDCPPAFNQLLRNVFNLSIAVDLIGQGSLRENLRELSTQSDLLDHYEDKRMGDGESKRAAAQAAKVMVEHRRLSVREVDVDHASTDSLLHSGILVRTNDRVGFAHHVLFDHVAGRFLLEWHEPNRLRARMELDPTIGFLLGPSFRFAMERMWRDDIGHGRRKVWSFVADLLSSPNSDPIVTSVAVRAVAEGVSATSDIEGIAELIDKSTTDRRTIGILLSRLARFVGIYLPESAKKTDAEIAWVNLASLALTASDTLFFDGALLLLWAIFDHGDLTNPKVASEFGAAARQLLHHAWSTSNVSPRVAQNAIHFVSKTFGTDHHASRELLQQIIEEPRFSEHACEEAPHLAQNAPLISVTDAEFVVRIFEVIFERDAPQRGTSWAGGHQSNILSLTSTRQQDYGQGRWHLTEFLPEFLHQHPVHATRAVIRAVHGLARTRASWTRSTDLVTHDISTAQQTVRIVAEPWSLEDWREVRRMGDDVSTILGSFSDFLLECSPDDFRACVDAIQKETSGTGVWSRLLGVASERVGVADDILWAIASTPATLSIRHLAKDAIDFLAAVYSGRPRPDREGFELAVESAAIAEESNAGQFLQEMISRFVSVAPLEALATEGMRVLRAELAAKNELKENEPFVVTATVTTTYEGAGDYSCDEPGVNTTIQIYSAMNDAERALCEALKDWPSTSDSNQLVALWQQIVTVRAEVAKVNSSPPPERMMHRVWGSVSNAVEKVVESKSFNPGNEPQPALPEVVTLVLCLARSPYPAPVQEEGSDLTGWGDVRFNAATCLVAMAARFGRTSPEIIETMRQLLSDPVAAVRWRLANALNVLYEVAAGSMREMMTFVAEHEQSSNVLAAYVNGSLSKIADVDPTRVESLLDLLFTRFATASSGNERGDRDLNHAIAGLVGLMWVRDGRPRAQEWIQAWTADLERNERLISSLLFHIRDALFFFFESAPEPASVELYGRAKEIVSLVVGSAGEQVIVSRKDTKSDVQQSEVKRSDAQQRYFVGLRILDQACKQLYFGSGAFKSTNVAEDRVGLKSLAAKQLFLQEYDPVLKQLAQAGGPPTLHELVKLYDFLSDVDPGGVFDRLGAMLLGPASDQGYQFERMAAKALVTLVRRYLADYRFVFDEPLRRDLLVKIMAVFAHAGWPEAMQLLYELPDLLR